MLETLIVTIAAFIATNIDDVIVFAVLSLENCSKTGFRQMATGRYIGTFLLLIISMIGVFGVSLLPDQLIGLLGLLPIGLGIKSYYDYHHDEPEQNDSAVHQADMTMNYTLLTIANGADNIGVYIPLFSDFSIADALTAAFVFALMTALFCIAVKKIAELPYMQAKIKKYQAVIVPSVLIILGLIIMGRHFL